MNSKVKLPAGKRKNRPADEADRLSISEDLLFDLYSRGVIPGLKISRKVVLFDPDAVDAALEKHFGNFGKAELKP
jgi:hypothetical protein